MLRQDNGLQTTDNGRAAAGNMDLRNYGFTELRKIGFALLRQTTDYRQRTTEGYAGTTELWNHGIAEASPKQLVVRQPLVVL